MDRTTQEMIDLVNILLKFNDNLPCLFELYPESEMDINVIIPYVDYEIKKTLKDIIHIERL
jgi:hypothetical protein